MKTCKTCKHGKRDWLLGWKFAKCYHPRHYKMDPVTGKKAYQTSYCSVERNYDRYCGSMGNLWESK